MRRALVLVSCLAVASSVSAQIVREFIGAPAPWTQGVSTDINDEGVVVGLSEQFQLGWTGWKWSPTSGMSVVPIRSVWGVNNSGDMVGSLEDSRGVVVKSTGEQVDIGTLGTGSTPIAINESGVVVGWSFNGSHTRPFMWTLDGGMTDLRPGAQTDGVAWAINSGGTIVFDDGGLAFVRGADGTTRELTVPGSAERYAAAINDQGDVVGGANFNGDYGSAKAVLWSSDGELTLLESPRRGQWCQARGISNSREIVGSCIRSAPYYDSFSFVILSDGQLLWLDDGLSAINNRGVVAGSYVAGAYVTLPERIHLPTPLTCSNRLLSLTQRLDDAVSEGGLPSARAVSLNAMLKEAGTAFCSDQKSAEQLLAAFRRVVLAVNADSFVEGYRQSLTREVDRILRGGGLPTE
jgi:hypothetical protein